jgi:hypothetical protein
VAVVEGAVDLVDLALDWDVLLVWMRREKRSSSGLFDVRMRTPSFS